MRSVSEGAVSYLLDPGDLQRTPTRVVARELLAACVLRPLMMWATPYYANKALYAVLREQQAKVGSAAAAGCVLLCCVVDSVCPDQETLLPP